MKYVLQANITQASVAGGYELIGLHSYGREGNEGDNDIIATHTLVSGTEIISGADAIIDEGKDDIVQQSCTLIASGDIE